jgi:hypothetical protein
MAAERCRRGLGDRPLCGTREHLRRALDADVQDHDAGLHSVVIRLARRVYRPLRHLGLTTVLPKTESIRRDVGAPSWLGEDWRHRFLFEPPGSADPTQIRHFEAELEDEAFKRARWADLALARVRLAERSIGDVLDFLGRRVAGTFWKRLLGGLKN